MKGKTEHYQRMAKESLEQLTAQLEQLKISASKYSSHIERLAEYSGEIDQTTEYFLGTGYELLTIVEAMSEALSQLVIILALIFEWQNGE